MSATFQCIACTETYQLHWRDPATPDVCRACAARAANRCIYPHPHDGHPCGWGHERPGEPCRYCGRPVPADGTACPACWVDLSSMPLADVKALFAADGQFDINIKPKE